MTTLILGADGQLGGELRRLLPEAIGMGRAAVDLTRLDDLDQALSKYQPGTVINCAAYTQVDRAEQEPALAFQVNALAPRQLAQWCAEANVKLVHISTDYVFGGDAAQRRPRVETESPQPESVYATSKLAGEYFVLAECPAALVVRSCGLYSQFGQGNFVRTMLRLGAAGKPLRVVNDQICSPTAAADLARGIVALLEGQASGLFHVVNPGAISWYDFARRIFQQAGLTVDVQPISSADYAAPARRPAYSVLDTSRFTAVTGMTLPPLETALDQFVAGS